MSAGSDILTAVNAAVFRTGDWVLVETGAESGAGARGTDGVGGTWPAISYANAAERDADLSQPTNRVAWLRSDGNVYYFNGLAWVQVTNDYYQEKAIPKTLSAQIIAKVGTKLKLSRAASAACTNANVYFDNWGILQDMVAASSDVHIPAGTWVSSCQMFIHNAPGKTIRGDGEGVTILKTVNGASHGGVWLSHSGNSVVRDFTVDANFTNDVVTVKFNDSRLADLNSSDHWGETYRQGLGGGAGVWCNASPDCEIRNVTVVNPHIHGIITQNTSGTWVRNCTIRLEHPYITYTQWPIQFADTANCGAEGCHIDSDWLSPGYNTFKSRNTTFRNCSTRNATAANNSSDGSVWENLSITIQDRTKGLSHFFQRGPIIDFNINAAGGFNENTSYVINPTIIQEGIVDAAQDEQMIEFSISNGNVCPVIMTGTYDTDTVAPKGLFQRSAPLPAGHDLFTPCTIRVSTQSMTIEGIRIIGELAATGPGHIHLEGTSFIDVSNCIFDGEITGATANLTTSGNMTNAEYEAL